ncbi:MAG TPA: glycosyltransferase family 1 protein [Thermoanaerobaculia bacterium]
MRIVQVVPRLPPPFEGVGTYASALAGTLAERGIETRFVTGDGKRTPEALLENLQGCETALLHYAGYGYQSRGCPLWLVRGLERWRTPGRRLVTFFHEVWATGPPWRSSFWLFPAQRRLAARLARLSAALGTSLEIYGELLRHWRDGREMAVMPVFSTVGEPVDPPPLAERARRIVVFGGAGVRRRTWGRHLPDLSKAVRDLGAEAVCDVGPPVETPAAVAGVPVRGLGVLPPEEVSALLLGSAAGFLAYPPAFLPKSTIFAAYCAHGVLPVCAWDGAPLDALCWTGSGDPQAVASAARMWYAGHSLERQAERFARLLKP